MKRLVLGGCLLLGLALTPPAPALKRPQPTIGSVIGRIQIPNLGVSASVYEGRSAAQLDYGPSHAPDSGLPSGGRPILIAGHRTTHGAWFRHINLLTRGDLITVYWSRRYGGTIRYRVSSSKVFSWDGQSDLLSRRGEFLALSACNPPGSAAQRLVVFAYPVVKRR